MTKTHIAVIGGAGFIGTHVVNKLLTLGHRVTVIDHFDPQVHGREKETQWDGRGEGLLISGGSVNWSRLDPVDVVIHLGAKVGVGQSMHKIVDYVMDNTFDTAHLLQNLTEHPPKRLVVASSMSIYGEGPRNYGSQEPLPTCEDWPINPQNIYALTKYDQERLCLLWGSAYDVPTVALRFWNTYGPGQSLNNPYTGVLAIFASRLLNDKPPIIYEDGNQTRDFIHVDDVAWAVVHAALEQDMPSGAYNVGTGIATTIHEVARMMIRNLFDIPEGTYPPLPIKPVLTGEHRKGDIRHCFADITKLRNQGWKPTIAFADGLKHYCAWLKDQPKPEDKFDVAHQELVEKGLTK